MSQIFIPVCASTDPQVAVAVLEKPLAVVVGHCRRVEPVEDGEFLPIKSCQSCTGGDPEITVARLVNRPHGVVRQPVFLGVIAGHIFIGQREDTGRHTRCGRRQQAEGCDQRVDESSLWAAGEHGLIVGG